MARQFSHDAPPRSVRLRNQSSMAGTTQLRAQDHAEHDLRLQSSDSVASTATSAGIASVLAVLRDAGFPGSVQRRRITHERKGLRSHRSVEDLEPAIPVGSFAWLPSR